MKYDFNRVVNRWNQCSAKYEEMEWRYGRKDLIPMWLADMDFMTAQPIIDALEKCAAQGIFGYTSRPDSYFESICDWKEKRHGFRPKEELCFHIPGVVSALSTMVQEFSKPGDDVVFFTPVYHEFFHVVENFGRKCVTVSLKEENGYYTVDWKAFEQALKCRPALFILCNPHNPVGRSWTKEELQKIGELCCQYDTIIISDEIHSDILLFGHHHTMMAQVSKEIAARTVTCTAATKTFNLAGLQAATMIFPNEEMLARCERFWISHNIYRNNAFNVVAIQAAFQHGEEWLEQLLSYLEGNILFTEEYLKEHIPEITFYRPQATFLLWLNCKALNLSPQELPQFMVEKAKLALSDGRSFGKEEGACYMRMNIACPRTTLEQAMKQLKLAVQQHRLTTL